MWTISSAIKLSVIIRKFGVSDLNKVTQIEQPVEG